MTRGNRNNIPFCSMPFVIPFAGLRRAFSIIVLQQSQLELKPVKLRIEVFGPIHVSVFQIREGSRVKNLTATVT